MSLDITALISMRLNRILLAAEAALPESQFKAYRKLVLDEFGNNGLGKDLAGISNGVSSQQGIERAGIHHAKKEVRHE